MQSNSNRGRNCCTATQRETRAAWLFLLPSLTGVVLFVLLPFAETVRRSLFDTMGTAWVGLEQLPLCHTERCLPIGHVHNTARFLGICLPILLSGSLVLALVLHSRPLRQTRAARIFKTTFLLPIAIPVASIVLLWQTLFARQGLCNGWLTCLGVQPIDFMGDRYSVLGFDRHLSVEKLAGIQAFFGRPGWKRFRSISMKQPASMVQGHGSSSGISPGLSSSQL